MINDGTAVHICGSPVFLYGAFIEIQDKMR